MLDVPFCERAMRRNVITLAWVILFLAGASPGAAQAVFGRITDRATGAPVADGVASLVDEHGAIVGRVPITSQGEFLLRADSPGDYLIQFVGPGYAPHVSPPLALRANQTIEMSFQVAPVSAFALEPVIVEGRAVPRRLAGFYQRRAAGFGDFVTREEFQRWNPRQLTDIMRRLPAVGLAPVDQGWRVVSRRDPRCSPVIFVDGAYVGTGMEFNLDAFLTVHTIEAVEAYAGAAAVPPELHHPGATCGAVAIWTRAGDGQLASRRHFELGPQAGGWLSSEGVQDGRLGLRIGIGVGASLEASPAINLILPGWRTRGTVERSGVQLMLSLRGRPLGTRSPWYVGAGWTYISVEESAFITVSHEHLLALTGLSWPLGAFRPFVEVQVVSPFGGAQIHLFTGVGFRLH